jgi:outer membrane lipopolysaccharide assembly protein LptE/RlpB
MRAFRLLFLLAGLATLAGCGHYRLGTEATTPFSTLQVEVVAAEVLLPQATVLVTTALREAFLQDGRVRLADTAEAADATLRVTLVSYGRGVAVVRPDDTGLARRFDLNLSARATLTDNRAGTTRFADRALVASRGVFTDSGQVPAEYQTLPLLAERLADEAVKAVLDVW